MVKSAERVTRAERKDWAREVMRGASSSLLPTFTPDGKDLDEEAIRATVRNAIAQGYFAVGAGGVGCTPAERERMLHIVLDEAGDKIDVYGGVGGGSTEEAIARAQEIEALGCSHFLLSFPARLRTVEELWDYTSRLCESTNMGVVLYGTNNNDFRHLHPSNIVFDVYDRLAELPNVVGMKLTQVMDDVTALMCAEHFGDKILLGPVNLEQAPMLAKLGCQIQWTGVWAVDAVNSPEKPYVVEFMDLLRQGRIADAEAYYFQFRDLLQLFWDVQAPWLRNGIHPQAHIKYYNYCVGGNGGLLREPPENAGHEGFPPLTAADRKLIRDTYEKVGISTSHLNDEEAMVGRSAYARGVRPSDLPANSTWQ